MPGSRERTEVPRRPRLVIPPRITTETSRVPEDTADIGISEPERAGSAGLIGLLPPFPSRFSPAGGLGPSGAASRPVTLPPPVTARDTAGVTDGLGLADTPADTVPDPSVAGKPGRLRTSVSAGPIPVAGEIPKLAACKPVGFVAAGGGLGPVAAKGPGPVRLRLGPKAGRPAAVGDIKLVVITPARLSPRQVLIPRPEGITPSVGDVDGALAPGQGSAVGETGPAADPGRGDKRSSVEPSEAGEVGFTADLADGLGSAPVGELEPTGPDRSFGG